MSQLENAFSDIANSIRTKLNTANTYTPGQMASAIGDIPTGDVSPYTYIIDGMMGRDLDVLNYNGAVNVGEYAFNGLTSLQSINLSNVQHIDYHSFYGCSNLTDAYLPNVTHIGNDVFEYCRNLRNVYAPNLVKANAYAFNDCGKLADINFPQLTDAGKWSFAYANGTDINCPNLANIGAASFAHMKYLTNVYLSNYVNNISDQVFYNCQNLSNVYMPNATKIGEEMFYACYKLTNFDFTNITDIDYGAFRSSGIGDINVGVYNNIGNYAFQYCKNIVNASFPNIIYANAGLLYQCNNLINVYMPNVINSGSDVFRECSNLTNVYIPNLRCITNWMFYYCTNLTVLDFPSVNAINEFAFNACYNFDTLILRANEVCNLRDTGAYSFRQTPFNNYGDKPAYLYVPNNLIADYQANARWSTILSYPNVSILPIEGSIYE